MNPPVITPPKAVDDISAPEDRFRCLPYNAVLFARTCVSRQDMLGKPREQRTGDYSDCDGCQVGMTIREKLGAGPAPAVAGKSTHGPGLPYYVPKMPGRARLPVAAPKPTPSAQAPSPAHLATPSPEAPVKRKPGRPPKPKPLPVEPATMTPPAPVTPPPVDPPQPEVAQEPTEAPTPVTMEGTEGELADFERELLAVRNGLLQAASKAEAIISDIRSARARLAAKVAAEAKC